MQDASSVRVNLRISLKTVVVITAEAAAVSIVKELTADQWSGLFSLGVFLAARVVPRFSSRGVAKVPRRSISSPEGGKPGFGRNYRGESRERERRNRLIATK